MGPGFGVLTNKKLRVHNVQSATTAKCKQRSGRITWHPGSGGSVHTRRLPKGWQGECRIGASPSLGPPPSGSLGHPSRALENEAPTPSPALCAFWVGILTWERGAACVWGYPGVRTVGRSVVAPEGWLSCGWAAQYLHSRGSWSSPPLLQVGRAGFLPWHAGWQGPRGRLLSSHGCPAGLTAAALTCSHPPLILTALRGSPACPWGAEDPTTSPVFELLACGHQEGKESSKRDRGAVQGHLPAWPLQN